MNWSPEKALKQAKFYVKTQDEWTGVIVQLAHEVIRLNEALTVLKQRPQGVEAAAKEIAEMIGECSFDEWSQDDVADIIARHTQPTNLERQYGKPLCLKHYYLCPDEDCNKQGTHVRYDVTAEQEKEQ